MEYYTHKGNNYYLIDLNSDEGYSFSEFGSSLGKVNAKYVVSISNMLTPVDILSILYDVTTNICEIYYKGKKALISEKGMNVYRKIPKDFPKETFIAFRISRQEQEYIGVSQLLIPFKKDCVSFEMLNNLFGIKAWY